MEWFGDLESMEDEMLVKTVHMSEVGGGKGSGGLRRRWDEEGRKSVGGEGL